MSVGTALVTRIATSRPMVVNDGGGGVLASVPNAGVGVFDAMVMVLAPN